MDSITIRRVTPGDFEDIFVLNLGLGYTYPKEKLKERIQYILDNTKDIILVAEIKEEVVGYIHASPYELMYFDSLMNILGFVVKEEKRGTGIGHKLITELERVAKESGFTGIRLTSGSTRTDAHRFYEKHGYINKKEQKNFLKIFA
jgi:predicted N-acetyltransferase YhbS